MNTKTSGDKKSFKKEFLILVVTISILTILASIVSYSAEDYMGIKTRLNYQVQNWMGHIGVYISFVFFQIFGKTAYIVMMILAITPLYILFAGKNIKKRTLSIGAGILFLIWAGALLLSIYNAQFGPETGGFLGGFFGQIIYRLTGKIGGYLLTVILLLIGISKFTGLFTVTGLFKKLLFNIHSASKYEINNINLPKGILKKKGKSTGTPLLTVMKVQENEQGELVKIEKTHVNDTAEQYTQHRELTSQNIIKKDKPVSTIGEKISGFIGAIKNKFAAQINVEPQVNNEIINRVIAKDPGEEIIANNAYVESPVNEETEDSNEFLDESLKELEKKFADISSKIESKKKKQAINAGIENNTDGKTITAQGTNEFFNNVSIPLKRNEFGIEMFGEDDDFIDEPGHITDEREIDIEIEEDNVDFEQCTFDSSGKQIIEEHDENNTPEIEEEHAGQNNIQNEPVSYVEEIKEDSTNQIIPKYKIEEKSKTEQEVKEQEKVNPFKKYKKPPMDILFISEEEKLEDHRKELEETAERIIDTLNEFKIELTRLIRCYRGPVITRYEFEVAPGIKMGKIESLADNIAYSLAAKKVRVIAPIPGKQAIGVEVPNLTRNNVLLGDLLNTKTFNHSKARLPLVLGKDISGKTIIGDLSSMPHLLIAGTTGSGKSVCINSILCSLLYQMRPEELRLILVDPKRVEMNSYSEIPHLLAPVVTDAKKAAMALNWAVDEMERRYELLEEAGCRDIKSFNEKIEENAQNGIAEYDRLHYIVIIIDELADLMLIARKEIENVVARLAAKARAAGIHLIFATQSPRADIITGIIKANFQPRIAFTVATKMESRIILDSSGAEKLLGKGDMLFYQPGFVEAGAAIRLQGAFVSDKEVEKVTEYLRSTCEPDYIEEVYVEEENENILEALSDSDEPIYHDAVRIVVDEQKASASYLQRRLQIGYNRAARMVEYMESEGIVGPAQGSKPREVLIDVYPY